MTSNPKWKSKNSTGQPKWVLRYNDRLKAAQSLPFSGLITFKMIFTASRPICVLPASTMVDSGTLVFNESF